MLCYLAGGLVLSYGAMVLVAGAGTGTSENSEPTNGLLLAAQALAQLAVFGFLTWLLGRRVLKLSWSELGWSSIARGRGFLVGLGGAGALAVAALLVGVLIGGAYWLRDAGSVLDYVRVVTLTTVSLAPAALAEEVAFRGFPLVVLERAVGRGTAIVVLSGLFAVLHAWNPGVTTLALGNIALAGVLLSLAFFAPGGIWTSWGAHLGWNASIAALDAPVSGLPFSIPFIDFNPGRDAWLTGGSFGPEGGLAATLVLGLGSVWLARYLRKDAHA